MHKKSRKEPGQKRPGSFLFYFNTVRLIRLWFLVIDGGGVWEKGIPNIFLVATLKDVSRAKEPERAGYPALQS